MKPKVSVFIPVYKESEHLPILLKELISQKTSKEIFVVIDEPTKESLRVSKNFKNKVEFIINKKRIGKSNALNKTVEMSSGNILLFLDDDVELSDNTNFLKKIIDEMKDADILDIKKRVVKDSFLSKMTYYEYVGFNAGSWMISKYLKKCPGVNGSAFAIRRKAFESLGGFRRVVSEDLDISTRAFLKEYRFKYTKKIEVYNHVHSSWREWISQRKRWSFGTALWFKDWYKELIKSGIKQPQIFIPAIFSLFPSLLLLILSFLTSDLFIYKTFSIFSLILSIKFGFILPILMLTTFGVNIIRSLFVTILSFSIFSVLFFSLSKKLGFNFKIHEFFFYYFFYSMLCLLVLSVELIQVFVSKKKLSIDWKT